MSGIIVNTNPNITTPYLTKDQKNRSVVLLDFSVNLIEDNLYRFDVGVIFNAIRIRPKNWIKKECFYLGCTGVDVELFGRTANVIDHTPDMTIEAERTLGDTKNTGTSVRFAPAYKADQGSKKTEISAGSVQYEKDRQKSFSTKIICSERFLAAMKLNDSVKWNLNPPRGSIVRDFLFGNLNLFADLSWDTEIPDGNISVQPNEIDYFNKDGAPVSILTRTCIEWVLSKHERTKSRIEFVDGVSTHFTITRAQT